MRRCALVSRAWIAADPAHAAAWEETHHLDGLIGQAQPALLQRQSQVIDLAAHRVRRRPRQLALVGALSMVAACLILVFAPGVLLQLQASHTTATRRDQVAAAQDGSTVQLDQPVQSMLPLKPACGAFIS